MQPRAVAVDAEPRLATEVALLDPPGSAGRLHSADDFDLHLADGTRSARRKTGPDLELQRCSYVGLVKRAHRERLGEQPGQVHLGDLLVGAGRPRPGDDYRVERAHLQLELRQGLA